MLKKITVAVPCFAAILLSGAVINNPDVNTVWREDGKNINWRTNPKIKVEQHEKGFAISSLGSNTALYAMQDSAYPYLTFDIAGVERLEKGYAAFSAGPLNMVTTVVPGNFCVKYNIKGRQVRPFRFDVHRYKIIFGGMAMHKTPPFFVELTNGSEVKKGGDMLFKVTLPEKAESVDLALFDSYTMPKLKVNGKSSFAMVKDSPDGKTWSLKIKLDKVENSRLKQGEKFAPGRILIAAKAEINGKLKSFYGISAVAVDAAK